MTKSELKVEVVKIDTRETKLNFGETMFVICPSNKSLKVLESNLFSFNLVLEL